MLLSRERMKGFVMVCLDVSNITDDSLWVVFQKT